MAREQDLLITTQAVKAVTKVLKARFTNLSVEETIDLATDIVVAISRAVDPESKV